MRKKAVPSWINEDFSKFSEASKCSTVPFDVRNDYPISQDKNVSAGRYADWNYTRQDLLVAQKIHKSGTDHHVDVGSRFDGFVTHVASFMNIECYDIRPMVCNIPGISFKQADLQQVPESLKGSTSSLSCLHALEHFGLGRYGDPIDPDGWIKGLDGLLAILKSEGTLYLSVPTSNTDIVHFNAHRLFRPRTIIAQVGCRANLIQFDYIDEKGNIFFGRDPDKELTDTKFSCGLFTFRKN